MKKLLYLAAGVVLFNCTAFFPAGKGIEEPKEKEKISYEIPAQEKDFYEVVRE